MFISAHYFLYESEDNFKYRTLATAGNMVQDV